MKEPEIIKLDNIIESLIVTIEEVGEWLNLGAEGTSFQSSMLEKLIKSAQRSIENDTWYDLNRKTYIASFDIDSISAEDEFILKKAPIFLASDIIKLEYLNTNNVWTEIPKGNEIVVNEIYENLNIKKDIIGYTRIMLKKDYELSTEKGIYKFKITFVSGYEISKGSGNFTVTIASPCIVTSSNHGLKTGDAIKITTTGVLPTGLMSDTVYYIIYIDENTFYLALTFLNSLMNIKINTSGSQSGIHSLVSQNELVPEDIKTAIKEIVEYNYLNRGEGNKTVIPESAKLKIDKYSIAKTVIC